MLRLQKTRWRGIKARDLGGGWKLFFSGVEIVLSEKLKGNAVKVKETGDIILSIKLSVEKKLIDVMNAHAVQMGCNEEENTSLWEKMDYELKEIPAEDGLIKGGAWRSMWKAERGDRESV